MADDQIASLRAAAHPLRLRMLSLLTGSAMSAAEVARELDITHANASYHLRVLRDAGEVVVDGEERIRGGMAKRYRHPWQDA
ncbi:MAG TPA: helix-turn-helix domain-containing protein, partial [Nocardioides sp.]|nr:helix-turn-helix domain-containing protein [Nocardioides sp.]